jgi:hypothetical protein
LLIIERQLPQNYKMVRISQHLISYFYMLWTDLPHQPLIVEVSPSLKGKMLGFSKRHDYDLKEWSSAKAVEILTFHQDLESLQILTKFPGKKDDLADTVCQEEALFMILYP